VNAVWRQARANLRSRKLQASLIFLTLAASALLITTALTAYFAGKRLYDQLMARTHGAHIVLSAKGDLAAPEELTAAVQANPDVVEATAPRTTFRFTLIAPNGKKDEVIVQDLDPDQKIASPWLVEGSLPQPGQAEILLDRNLAAARGIHVGDEVTLLAGEKRNRFTVAGTFVTSIFCAYPGCRPARAYLAPGALATAMQKEGVKPESWEIALRLRHPQQAEAVFRDLLQTLPQGGVEGYTWLKIRRFVGFDVRLQAIFMLAFAVLAALVGGFLIANAISGALRAQTRQIGLLRAIGFTNGQLAGVYLSEYLALGLVAGLLGMIAGVFLAARLFVDLTARYAAEPVHPPLGVLAATLAAVLLVVLLAALLPLRRITRLDTVTAIRQGMEPPRRHRARLLRRLPLPVAHGLASLLATPTRSLLTALGLAVVTLAVTVALSLGATVRAFADDPQGMGIVPEAEVEVIVGEGISSESLLQAIQSRPDVISYACQAVRGVRLAGESDTIYPRFLCGDVSLFDNMLLEGRLPQADDEATAAYTIAREHNWHVGDAIRVVVDDQTYDMRLVGIYRDMNNVGQMLILPYHPFFADKPPRLFYLRLSPDADPHVVLAELQQQFGEGLAGEVVAETLRNADSGQNVGAMLERTVQALALLLGVIAMFGVLSSVSMSVHEDRRLVGILKALGMTPAQVVSSILSSAAALALIGYVAGAPLGVVAARALFRTLAGQVGLGPIPVPVDGRGLALLLPGMLLVAGLGAYLPARRAARQSVTATLRDE